MMKKLLGIILISMLIVMGSAVAREKKLYPEGTPTRSIQDLDAMLDQYRVSAKQPEDVKFNAELKERVLKGTFDIRRLCRLALARHWNEVGKEKQDKFVELMTQLLSKKAIFSREQGGQKGQSIKYFVENKGHTFLNEAKDKAVVKTVARIPSEAINIGLEYKMIKEADSQWKIYDVIVDGASLLNNYRYQFDTIIKKDGFADLMHRMESKLKELNREYEKKLGHVPPEESSLLSPRSEPRGT